ncbi:MAG TPA: hypothetical protein VFN79_08015 [Steroidobacteraceae bacterium]|nr:hypothetical protein [Steroidobacteraceae bacterium]
MAAECGLGLYDLALLHLIGHALYKAAAFLSSGSAVDESIVRRMSPGAGIPSAAAQLLAAPVAALLGLGSALLLCAFGMAALLWEAAAGPGAALWSLAGAALGMQLYLLWQVVIDRGIEVASSSPAPVLALYSAACFLGLYVAQCRIGRPAAARDGARLRAWVAAVAKLLARTLGRPSHAAEAWGLRAIGRDPLALANDLELLEHLLRPWCEARMARDPAGGADRSHRI